MDDLYEATAYESLTESVEDLRWAYGTGFAPPLAGVDTAVPPGVDAAALADYCLMLGDDALFMSHRLQQWVTRAPELEEETALANIALDLLGQARLLLTRAGQADGSGRSEDDYAYLRAPEQFRNVALVEPVDDQFGRLVARLLIFATWRLALFERLRGSSDPVLAAVAGKGVAELAYHRDYAARWALRLGDGTPTSHERMQSGLDDVWREAGELFARTPTESALADADVAVDPSSARVDVDQVLARVADAATLVLTDQPSVVEPTGRLGQHGLEFADMVTELQSFARENTGARW